MGFFSKFENKIEYGFENLGTTVSKSPITPVQITKKAESMMRRQRIVGSGIQYAPTLYTVLVSPQDDHHLFGHYPTLAAETQTCLSAKAHAEGMVMDGTPLVRCVIDDKLKSGKFEIIAEVVASIIVTQLRAQEMQRYGISTSSYAPYYESNRALDQGDQNAFSPAQSSITPQASDDFYQENSQYEDNNIEYSMQPPATLLFNQEPDCYNQSQAAPANNRVLAILQNIETGQEISVCLLDNILGREASCDIQIHDPNASRNHARLCLDRNGAWVLIDNGSTNGTFVDGQKITSCNLEEGQRITIGTSSFVFEMVY